MRILVAAVLSLLLLLIIGVASKQLQNSVPDANVVSSTSSGQATDINTGDKADQNSSASSNTSSAPINEPPANISEPASINIWVIFVLIFMAIALAISSAISFYLYRWRKILLSSPTLVVPEQLGEWVGAVNGQIKNFSGVFDSGFSHLIRQSEEVSKSTSNLTETFMTLQHALDERDAEIRRLKRGYDAEIFRKFITRFIRVDQHLADCVASGATSIDDLEQVRRLLDDAFAECEVESFRPEIGSDYRSVDGVAENPKSIKATNPEDAFKIVEVLEDGYHLKTLDGFEVLLPAKVRIQVP